MNGRKEKRKRPNTKERKKKIEIGTKRMIINKKTNKKWKEKKYERNKSEENQ